MRTSILTLACAAIVLVAASDSARAGGFGYVPYHDDCGCGHVPVASFEGAPVVAGTPGYHASAGPHGYGRGYGYGYGCGQGCGYGCGYGSSYGYGLSPIVTTRVYYPFQPVRNVLKVLAP